MISAISPASSCASLSQNCFTLVCCFKLYHGLLDANKLSGVRCIRILSSGLSSFLFIILSILDKIYIFHVFP